MKLWSPPLTRRAAVGRASDPADAAFPAFVLRTSPVLLLAGPPADAMVDRLLHEWNPLATLPSVADGVHWAGPFRLDAVGSADALLPAGWSTAYAARAVRGRVRIPDGLDANLLRLRYPHGMPTGAEAVAWSLIMGLARRLGGAGRLPTHSSRGARTGTAPRIVTAQRALAQENSYCVYGADALPWSTLRSVLCLSLPDLDRNGALTDDDYCLDRPGAFEVRVQPFRADTTGERGETGQTGQAGQTREFVPYALRSRATADWPRTVYRLRCLPQQTERAAQLIDVQLRAAACQLADVIGGVLLDGDGFPMGARAGAATGARMRVG